ncbi:SusD/RagB family nutrient-binding outer membrane lipoprotein [Reichenbachiella sp. MALMAid0571]|uniref:SusD/RagB family nutrient-binding outer membrane lipoprotein n=1 Tax=Reichenbachiella sp. MALMAid0571 TaxID=3143939 RepID=UPI0032DF0C31
MKYNLYKIVSVLAITVAVFSACTDDYEKLNTNPSLLSADQLEVGLLLTKVQKRAIIDYGAYPLNAFGNYAGYSSSGGNLPFNGGFFPSEFSNGYKSLVNISEIIRLTTGNAELVNKHSIARIMRVYIYQHLTDLYGDIPYSDAVKSIDEVETQPKYDTQESIYNDLLNELEEAADELDASAISYGASDLIYGGDVDKWKRFANSLRLRLALRIIYADASLATSQIAELIGADLIESNSGNAFVATSEDFESNRNPIYNEIIRVGGVLSPVMTNTLIDILKNNGDPRLSVIAQPTLESANEAELNNDPGLLVYRGRPLGLDGSEEREHYQPNEVSQIGTWFTQPTLDMPAMYYSEVCFALAEAKLKLDLGNEAADVWYKKGIRASMEYYGVSEPDIIDFLSTTVATLSGTEEEQLEQIISQKNVALFPNSTEAWSEWRRTGYPRILIGSMTGETNGQIPRRINYPTDEINLNSANYQAVSSRIGGDNLTSKVWWDANPNVPYSHTGNILD